jgi:hypothetical protein
MLLDGTVFWNVQASDDSTDLTRYISEADFKSLLTRLLSAMGFKTVSSAEENNFFALQCRRGFDEFGLGRLCEHRLLKKQDIELLHKIAAKNYLIFSYHNLGFSKCKDFAGSDIDVMSGLEFVRLINEHLNVTIISQDAHKENPPRVAPISSTQPTYIEKYEKTRYVLEALATDSDIRSKIDDYDKTVGALIFYSINLLVLDGHLDRATAKNEYVQLLEDFQVKISEGTRESIFDMMFEKQMWFEFAQGCCKYDLNDMGIFWQIVVAMVSICQDGQRLVNIFEAYTSFMAEFSVYLGNKYNSEFYLTQVKNYMKPLMDNVLEYAKTH